MGSCAVDTLFDVNKREKENIIFFLFSLLLPCQKGGEGEDVLGKKVSEDMSPPLLGKELGKRGGVYVHHSLLPLYVIHTDVSLSREEKV